MDRNIKVITLHSKLNKMKKDKFVVLSPDGFPIRRDKFYYSHKTAIKDLNEWMKGYEVQGYYSSVQWGRIPLNELNYYCQIKQIN